jgi:hypothetical protein
VGTLLLLRHPLFRGGTLTGYAFQDADAEAYVLAMSVEPDDVRKLLIEEFITGLKDDDIWDEIALGYLLAAHDGQAGRLNFKDPAVLTAGLVSSPTFTTDRGYTGDGVSSKLRTNWDPTALGAAALPFAQNSAHAMAWTTTSHNNTNRVLGNTGVSQVKLQPSTGASQSQFNMNTANVDQIATTSAATIGFFLAQRIDANNMSGWSDTTEVTKVQASVALPSSEQFLVGGTTNSNIQRLGAASWGSSLDTKEVAYRNRLLTYMQGVGAA